MATVAEYMRSGQWGVDGRWFVSACNDHWQSSTIIGIIVIIVVVNFATLAAFPLAVTDAACCAGY